MRSMVSDTEMMSTGIRRFLANWSHQERRHRRSEFWASGVFTGGERRLSGPGIEWQVSLLGVECLGSSGSKDWMLGCSQIVDNLQCQTKEFWLDPAGGREALRRHWRFPMIQMAWWKWYFWREIQWEWGVCSLYKMRQEPGKSKTNWKATIIVQTVMLCTRKNGIKKW